jgi:hypothetical protein
VVLGIQSNECGDTCQGVGRIAVQASQRQRGRQHGHGVQSAGRMERKRHEVRPGKGVPETSYWPEGDNKRHWDSPDTWQNAAENVVLEWWDIDPGDTAAIMTCLLLNYPVAVDIPAWGHSVCLIDPVDAAGKEFDQLNSWGNNWNGNGIGRLKGKYTRFSSAIACTVVTGG